MWVGLLEGAESDIEVVCKGNQKIQMRSEGRAFAPLL
jgi:hypothetical protein